MPMLQYKKSELYERVVERYNIFEYKYEFTIFLAVLGYAHDNPKRTNFRGSSEEGTRGTVGLDRFYSNELYRSLMACLAFQDSNDPEALVDSDRQMKTLAQYAAGGLEIAEREFGDVAGDPTDAIVNYVQNNQGVDDTTNDELQRIVESFDDEMMKTGGEQH